MQRYLAQIAHQWKKPSNCLFLWKPATKLFKFVKKFKAVYIISLIAFYYWFGRACWSQTDWSKRIISLRYYAGWLCQDNNLHKFWKMKSIITILILVTYTHAWRWPWQKPDCKYIDFFFTILINYYNFRLNFHDVKNNLNVSIAWSLVSWNSLNVSP